MSSDVSVWDDPQLWGYIFTEDECVLLANAALDHAAYLESDDLAATDVTCLRDLAARLLS